MRKSIVIVSATLVVIAALIGSYASPLVAAANREISSRLDVKDGQELDRVADASEEVVSAASQGLGNLATELATEKDPSPSQPQKRAKAFLGLVLVDADDGARVTQVYVGGPAQRAGVKQGDIVRKVNGIEVGNAGEVVAEVGKHKPGDTVTLAVFRSEEETTINVVAESEPTMGVPRVLESPRAPELEGLSSLPLGQLFGRFLSAELTFEGKDGQHYTLKAVSGTIREINPTQVVIDAGDASATREFVITETTLIYSGLAKSKLDKLKAGEKVVVIVVGDTNRAAVVAKTMPSWPLQRPIPNYPPPKNWGRAPDVQ